MLTQQKWQEVIELARKLAEGLLWPSIEVFFRSKDFPDDFSNAGIATLRETDVITVTPDSITGLSSLGGIKTTHGQIGEFYARVSGTYFDDGIPRSKLFEVSCLRADGYTPQLVNDLPGFGNYDRYRALEASDAYMTEQRGEMYGLFARPSDLYPKVA